MKTHREPKRFLHRILRHDERGEGVVSAAIAVLIMAFLGVGMWVAFNSTFSSAERNVDHKVNACVGQTVQAPDC
jgi:hypothetical protein